MDQELMKLAEVIAQAEAAYCAANVACKSASDERFAASNALNVARAAFTKACDQIVERAGGTPIHESMS